MCVLPRYRLVLKMGQIGREGGVPLIDLNFSLAWDLRVCHMKKSGHESQLPQHSSKRNKKTKLSLSLELKSMKIWRRHASLERRKRVLTFWISTPWQQKILNWQNFYFYSTQIDLSFKPLHINIGEHLSHTRRPRNLVFQKV